MSESSRARPRRHSEFPVFGSRCRTVDLAGRLEEWIRERWEQACSPQSETDYRIDVARCTSPLVHARSAAAVETTALAGATLTWKRHAERWWSTGDGGVSLRLFDRRARIRVWIGDSRAQDATLLALHVAFCEALRARGLVPLHAAVLVRDGAATALMGRGGVGKTTTLLGAIDDGWLPLCEDFGWLEPSTRRVFCWKGERGVHLDATGLSRLRAGARLAQWRAGSEKFELPWDAFAPERPTSAELTRVVLLARDASQDSMLRPLAPQEATRALWESAGVPLCRINRDAFAARVPELIAMLGWHRLILGHGRPAL